MGGSISRARTAHAARGAQCAGVRPAKLAQTHPLRDRIRSVLVGNLVYGLEEGTFNALRSTSGSPAADVVGRRRMEAPRSNRRRRRTGTSAPPREAALIIAVADAALR
jgi:hypothetical protein